MEQAASIAAIKPQSPSTNAANLLIELSNLVNPA